MLSFSACKNSFGATVTSTFDLLTPAPVTTLHFHFITFLQLVFCHPCYIMYVYYIIYSLFCVFCIKILSYSMWFSANFFPSVLCWGDSPTLLCVVLFIYFDCWNIVLWANRPHFTYSLSMDCFQLVSFFKLKTLLFRSFSKRISWYACARISLGHVPKIGIVGSDLQNNEHFLKWGGSDGVSQFTLLQNT